MKNAFRPALAFALFLGASSARAEDFNFTVPVQASNLPPNVEGLTVVCAALARGDVGLGAIGGASVRVAVTGGAYRDDVVVRFNANPGKDPRLATRYQCVGAFDGHERGVAAVYFRGGSKYQQPVFPLAPGATFSLTTGIDAARPDVALPPR
jgi:zona occludens toxin (predicted ATPase)